jgi:hypothetical protein
MGRRFCCFLALSVASVSASSALALSYNVDLDVRFSVDGGFYGADLPDLTVSELETGDGRATPRGVGLTISPGLVPGLNTVSGSIGGTVSGTYVSTSIIEFDVGALNAQPFNMTFKTQNGTESATVQKFSYGIDSGGSLGVNSARFGRVDGTWAMGSLNWSVSDQSGSPLSFFAFDRKATFEQGEAIYRKFNSRMYDGVFAFCGQEKRLVYLLGGGNIYVATTGSFNVSGQIYGASDYADCEDVPPLEVPPVLENAPENVPQNINVSTIPLPSSAFLLFSTFALCYASAISRNAGARTRNTPPNYDV